MTLKQHNELLAEKIRTNVQEFRGSTHNLILEIGDTQIEFPQGANIFGEYEIPFEIIVENQTQH